MRFTLPRDLYHGKGALENLKNLEGKKAIVCVGGGSMKRNGFLDRAVKYLEEAGMEVKLYEGIDKRGTIMQLNPHYAELNESYLFSTIAHKVADYQKAHPDADIIRLGIGDVTLPLAASVTEAMHRAVEEQGHKDTFHGYIPSEQGYEFLRDAILLTIADHGYINVVTKRLYPEIAKRNGTTASRVERAIRHAIEVAWDRGDVDTLNSYLGYTIHNLRGKPTNSEFIAMIADKMRLDKRQQAG